MEWQPIETHPHQPDVPFLCCNAGDSAPYVASWKPDAWKDDPNNEVWSLWLEGEFYGLSCRPDFWMPLPAPPA
jgi:hypothetical protein